MSAATMTPAMAGADLLNDLRQLVNRYDGASSTEDVRQICDKAAQLVGRARRLLARFERQAAPERTEPKPEPPSPPVIRIGPDGPITPAPERRPEPEPASAVRPPEPSAAETPKRPTVAAERPAPRAATIEIRPDRPLPAPVPQPAKRRRIAVVLATLAGLWSMLCIGTVRAARRVGRAVKSTVRWTSAQSRAEQLPVEVDDHPGECIVCGPGCCSPILGVHGTRAGPLVGRTAVSVR